MTGDSLALSSVTSFIEGVVRDNPLNRLHHTDTSPIFASPIVGVADGDDPLFQQYKEIIGPYHLTPRELLARDLHGPQQQKPPAGRVLCWILAHIGANKTNQCSADTGALARMGAHALLRRTVQR